MSTWATVATAAVLGATEGDAGGAAEGVLVVVETVVLVGVDVVTATASGALCAWDPAGEPL